jgi:hypothetical protein
VDAVLDFLKQRAPEPLKGQIDSLASGGAPDLGKMAGGLFGR